MSVCVCGCLCVSVSVCLSLSLSLSPSLCLSVCLTHTPYQYTRTHRKKTHCRISPGLTKLDGGIPEASGKTPLRSRPEETGSEFSAETERSALPLPRFRGSVSNASLHSHVPDFTLDKALILETSEGVFTWVTRGRF